MKVALHFAVVVHPVSPPDRIHPAARCVCHKPGDDCDNSNIGESKSNIKATGIATGARQSAKLSDIVRCVPKRATATATAKATATAAQQQQTGKRQRTCNRRKSSEWPMTTKLAVKHTKITSNGQKVNKIKQRTRGDSQPGCKEKRLQRLLLLLQLHAQHVASIPSEAAATVARCSLPVAGCQLAVCLLQQQHNPPASAQRKND